MPKTIANNAFLDGILETAFFKSVVGKFVKKVTNQNTKCLQTTVINNNHSFHLHTIKVNSANTGAVRLISS
jgi:hypothetical protein